MTTTTMHFGPEWMRPKHALRPQNPPSPPPSAHAPPGASSYSALLTPSLNNNQEPSDAANPFLYSKEDLLKIYKEGGGRGGLGLEVERWEGVVRELGSEPVSLKEWSDAERKLFAGSINSEVRRRQSTDYLSPLVTQPGERPKLSHSSSGLASPLRERFGGIMRKREGTDQPPLTIPRKLSLSSTQGPLGSPRDGGLPSPRTRGPVTPGFDGILNSGETWTSRRRASESGMRSSSGAAPRGDGDTELPSMSKLKIDEEEEQQHRSSGAGPDPGVKAVPSEDSGPPSGISHGEAIGNGPSALSSANGSEVPANPMLHNGNPSQGIQPGHPGDPNPANSAPPSTASTVSIEWSYLDPQGQVQGPFQAELMQKWYEEGYFSADLLMRRANLDEDWTSVGELAHRAGGEKLFLFNFDTPPVPPGLSRRQEPPRDPFPQQGEINGYNAPYQPVPTRTIHPSALNSYFPSSSPASNSPSSSFGAGRFDGSPDPAAFGGHVAPMYSGESPVGSRSGNFVDPSFIGARRTGYADAQYEQGFGMRAGPGNPGPVRTPSVDGYGLNASIPSQAPWGQTLSSHPALSNINTGSREHISSSPYSSHLGSGLEPGYPSESPLGRSIAAQQDVLGQNYGSINQRDLSRLGSRELYQLDHRTGLGIGAYDGGSNVSPFDSPIQHQPFNQSPSMNFASPVSQQTSAGPAASTASIPTSIAAPTIQHSQPTWNDVAESAPKRTGLTPFDTTVFPTSRNTTSTRTAPPAPSQSWAPSKQSAPNNQSQSPWYSASHGVTDDGWGHVAGPHSLTAGNLDQHTHQQDSDEGQPAASAAVSGSPLEPSPSAEATQSVRVSSTTAFAEPSQQPIKSRRKSSVHSGSIQPAAQAPPVPAQPIDELTLSPAAAAAPVKPVWSIEDDKKKNANGPTSLREIQELEAKKQETRKTAERERARTAAAATTAAPATEEAQSFTASWGLSTSQVGAKTPAKEAPSGIATSTSSSTSASTTTSPAVLAPTAPPSAVWTNAQKPVAKKSMKDILEEEERRRKTASKESAAAAAARRAYAETTNKTTTPVPSVGGAWTTVGANGKTTPAAVVAAPAPRPTITPSSSVASVAASSSRGSIAVSAARSPVPPAKVVPVAPKVDDLPIAPSPEFMKWLNDSLKQLNSTVNYEEIASMLLSFPLDGDATTAEIISELVYDNSTTLDGRRFAQEFITKRKADAASRKTSGRAPSIADVVKAQPKPSQQAEWGGFKVVKKQKKGGRA
ncbi:hypothetical protein BC834DRAFT_860468 [Gloeopeniophorella convolvens]|nr:hypothetical protein BC834DRAFT_860468 [Gloeopeniophorella convolvens]